jgi:hypothetical protein
MTNLRTLINEGLEIFKQNPRRYEMDIQAIFEHINNNMFDGFTPNKKVLKAIENLKEEVKDCNDFTYPNLPYETIIQMRLNTIYNGYNKIIAG